ncbi:MAG: DNA helicase RecQ [Ruminococcus sp.]|nr:DNA helicase RecQ [Ruminococcus sp.]
MDKLDVLKEYFGHDSFRPGQAELIDAVLAGRDVLGIMPTSAGKSMCFQVPALMSGGTAVVVSPLISLMKDQVNALIQSGVNAAYLNSSLTQGQYETALANAARGAYKLIYVAPERLCTPSFLSLASKLRLSIVAVDEAHCVSQWGQDFRPSYMRIPEFLSSLPYRPPVAAFTATATAEVKQDIIAMLGLNAPLTVTTGFDRQNLFFSVVQASDKYAELKKVMKRSSGSSGIIYCATRKTVEEVSAKLTRDGYVCGRYHAGLSDEERRRTQDDFIYDRIKYIAATNAFGMGIDKSNVRFVVHYNMPKNIESYYQEAGRAGRDGEKAECVLLYGSGDIRTNRFMIEKNNENAELDPETAAILRERDLDRLQQMISYSTTSGCLREFILRYFGEAHEGYCGACSNCVNGFEETDITIEAQKILSCIYRLRERRLSMGAANVAAILRGSKAERITSRGLDTLSTYGIMKDVPSAQIRQMIALLCTEGYIKVEGDFSVLILTAKAKEILSGGKKLMMKLPKGREKTRRNRNTVGGIYQLDQDLFGKLRKLRTSLAEDAGVPPYVIFTDSTLRDICVKLPVTDEELLNCSGIGRAKLERYGKNILSAVKEYIAENGDAPGKKNNGVQSGGSNMLFKLIRFNRSKLTPSKEPLTLSSLCDRILECLSIAADKKLIQEAIGKWLIENSYLAPSRDGKGTELTILSEEAGLVELNRISRFGQEYKNIYITAEGQAFIFSNADEIFCEEVRK